MNAFTSPRPIEAFFQRWLSRQLLFAFALLAAASSLMANDIQWLSLSMPATATGGSTLTITATVTNAGGEQWGSDHYLAMRDSSGAVVSLESVEWVSPGETVTREIHYGLPNPVGTETYTFTFQALEHNVEWFGSIDTRSVVVTETLPYVYTGMQLSPTAFSDAAHPLISTSDGVVSAPYYRLRAKVIDGTQYGFHMANEWKRNNYPVDTVRGLTPGDYATCALYWVTYSSYWGAVQSIGPERRVPITVRHAVELTTEAFHETNPPNVRFGGALTGNYRLYATFRNSQGTWETAGGLNNNNTRIGALPPAGTYSASLFYRKFDGGMNVIETSEVHTVPATITSGPVQVLSEGGTIVDWTYENDDGWVLTGYSENTHWFYVPITGTLRLRTTGVVDLSGSLRGMAGTEILAETPLAVSAGEWLSVTVTGTTASGYYQIIGEVTPGFTSPTVTGASTAAGVVGSPFASYTASANGTGPLAFSASNLPPGLSINPGTGAITGSPTAAGTYAAWIAVANAAGSSGRWVSFTIAPAIPPGKPTALVPVTIGSSVITLYWNAPTGNPSAATYEVEANNVSFGATHATSMTLTGLTPGTLYNLKVRAASAAGVWSQWSADYIASTAPAIAPGRSTSVWMELPHRQRDANKGVLNSLYYTGIQDEILPFGPDGVIGFRWVDYQPSYTISAIGYDDGISLNDYWSLFNSSGADGSSVFAPRFEMPPLLFANLTSLIASIEATYATKEGETYQVYEDPVGSPVFSPTNLDLLGEEFPSPSTGTHSVVFPNYELISVYRPSFYVVRRGKPIGGARIALPGAGPTTVGIRTIGGSAGPTAGPINIGGMTIDVGVGTGSVAFPGGGTISINGGVVSVAGIAGLPNGPVTGSVSLGGLGSVEVDTAGNATVAVGSGVPVMSGVVIRANAAGGGEITLANGVGISISNAGRMGLTLPPGTDPTIVQAVDVATRILSVGAGAVISVRDALGAITPLPTSGVLGAIDAAITSKGLYEVGIKLGTDSTFWFDVFTFPKPRIAVDANRDGVIAFDASDATTSEKPYRFWINDDDDRLVDESNQLYTELEEDDRDVGATGTPNWRDDTISCMRDLEDFSRLWINLKGATDSVRNGQLFVGLRWANIAGDLWIKLYPHVEADGGTKYLFDARSGVTPLTQYSTTNAIANLQYGTANNTLVASVSGTFVFPTSVFASLSESSPVAHLLFEGCSIGTGELKLVLLKQNGFGYTEIAQVGSVWFDLKESKDFIERWSCGDDVLGEVQPVVRVNSKSVSPAWGKPIADEEKDYVIYVHGYNMKEFEKQRWVETTHKRLWHLGYNGRVGSFTWPCSQSARPYDASEEKAWQSAVQLMALLSSLKTAGYRVHVLGHSQGNVVVGEALKQWKGTDHADALVRTYVASQAAIQAHCYDPNAALIPDFAGSSTDNNTPNVYVNFPPTGAPYLSASVMSGAATRFRNFENPRDYALTGNSLDPSDFRPGWQASQRLKPDIGYGWTAALGFYKGDGNSLSTRYYFPNDRFQIFSFCAEGRSLALGSTTTDGVFANGNIDLSLAPFSYGREHLFHSAQFRSYMAQRYQYWIALLDAASIPHLNP